LRCKGETPGGGPNQQAVRGYSRILRPDTRPTRCQSPDRSRQLPSCLNDATEYEFALKLARDMIDRRLKETRNNFGRGLYTVLLERLSEARVDVYVSSFTENGDQL